MEWRLVLFLILVLLSGISILVLYGRFSWRTRTQELLAKLESDRLPAAAPELSTIQSMDSLPDVVRRYFRLAMGEDQPFVSSVTIEHEGKFNTSATGEQWKPFRSRQYVRTRPPGFVWDARIRLAPGLTVFVHDAYVNGRGVLRARIRGAVPVMDQPDSPELAEGELMRFLAEAVWYPTALLPSRGVRWNAAGDHSAIACLSDRGRHVSLEFHFDGEGLISTVRSSGRYRLVGQKQVATPWQGRFWDYQKRGKLLVPLEGEVAWLLSEGPLPYWRGRVRRIAFECCD